jgi:hypothetical protein
MVKTDNDPEKLKKFLAKVCQDDIIRQKFKDLKKKRKDADNTIKDFSHRIKTLSQNKR